MTHDVNNLKTHGIIWKSFITNLRLDYKINFSYLYWFELHTKQERLYESIIAVSTEHFSCKK
jgi:hypothetical protein